MLFRCNRFFSMQNWTFERFMTSSWEDECPVPGLMTADKPSRGGDTVFHNLLACRAEKYRNFLNISSWAPNVEVSVDTIPQQATWVAAELT
jgi:hypothetical protein